MCIRPLLFLIVADTVEIFTVCIAATMATLTYRQIRKSMHISETVRSFHLRVLLAASAQVHFSSLIALQISAFSDADASSLRVHSLLLQCHSSTLPHLLSHILCPVHGPRVLFPLYRCHRDYRPYETVSKRVTAHDGHEAATAKCCRPFLFLCRDKLSKMLLLVSWASIQKEATNCVNEALMIILWYNFDRLY